MRALSLSFVMPLLSQILSAMLFQMELIITWFCSRFSSLGLFFIYISPADLYFPWRMSWTLTPNLSRRSFRNMSWVPTPVIMLLPPEYLPMYILSAAEAR